MIRIEDILRGGDPVTVKATGRSMRPTFRNKKDYVELTPWDVNDLHVGDVVFFDRGDQYCLHRIIEISGDNLVIRGDGNRPEALERVKRSAVAGKVTGGTMHGGKPFVISDRRWQENTRRVMKYYPIIAFAHRIWDILCHYPLSILVLGVLMYLSFADPRQFKSMAVIESDKVAHFLMYFGMSLVYWFEWMRQHRGFTVRNVLLGVVFCLLFPIAVGGIIEIAQEKLTYGRRCGDWYDFLANSMGAFVATMVSFAVTLPVLRFCKRHS